MLGTVGLGHVTVRSVGINKIPCSKTKSRETNLRFHKSLRCTEWIITRYRLIAFKQNCGHFIRSGDLPMHQSRNDPVKRAVEVCDDLVVHSHVAKLFRTVRSLSLFGKHVTCFYSRSL